MLLSQKFDLTSSPTSRLGCHRLCMPDTISEHDCLELVLGLIRVRTLFNLLTVVPPASLATAMYVNQA